ncbi:MAG: hypothetical protein AB1640_06325 [bacterium]
MSGDELVHPADGPLLLAACGLRETLILEGPWSETELRAAVDRFLSELRRDLKEAGCALIGHIKGIVDAGETGQLFFSVTSFQEQARYKGRLTGSFTKVDLTLNVIVCGVESGKIERAVREGLRRHVGRPAGASDRY